MPWQSVLITIACFTVLSIFYKLSARKRCDTFSFCACLYGVAALASVVPMGASGAITQITSAPPGLTAMGLAAGACAVACLTFFFRALQRGGSLSITTALTNLSILLPILFAIACLDEAVTWHSVLGVLCFIFFVVLINSGVETPAEEDS